MSSSTEDALKRIEEIRTNIDKLSSEALFLVKTELGQIEYNQARNCFANTWNKCLTKISDKLHEKIALQEIEEAELEDIDTFVVHNDVTYVGVSNPILASITTNDSTVVNSDPEVDVGIESPDDDFDEDSFHQAVS